jgi:hypothetical protein
MLAAPTMSVATAAATAAPAVPARQGTDRACDRHGHGDAVPSASARLDRVDDQRSYSARELRRIDSRLERVLARKGLAQARSTARFGLTLRIPVRAHVIDGNRSRGPSRRAVAEQVDILNRAYGGGQSSRNTETRFRFYMESFERTRNQRWYTAALFDQGDRQLRRRLHRGGPESLNLYFSAPHTPQADSVVLGWSSMPWQSQRNPRLDGVTIHHESMTDGALRRYNRGDTAVHEVGHWLGLFHTFQGGCSKNNDMVDDTPAEAEPSLTCQIGRDTCSAAGRDPIRNFMNYSFDSCMNSFTPGQVVRMTDNWLAYRTP